MKAWAKAATVERPSGMLLRVKFSGASLPSRTPAANFLAWWDGDLLREIVDHDYDATVSRGVPTISKWNWETETSDRLLTADGARSNNTTKGNPSIQADILGDWREEIAWPSTDSTELRIYTTTAPTEVRLRTLMHDTVYRTAVARENVAYNQPPHPGFFIGEGMQAPAAPAVVYTGTK